MPSWLSPPQPKRPATKGIGKAGRYKNATGNTDEYNKFVGFVPLSLDIAAKLSHIAPS
jgi:hypothetical protein